VPRRRAALAVIITLGVIAAGIALTGTVIASSRKSHPARFRSPLLVYPVTQSTPGQCPPGTRGITGPGTQGQTCYQVTQGIIIHRVTDIHVQRGGSGYEVSMSLLPADSRSFATLTRRMAGGGSLALVVRGRLVTAPSVQGPITRGKILISGAASRQDADRLVSQLKGTTSPPAPVVPTQPAQPLTPASSGLPSPGLPLPGQTTPGVAPPNATSSAPGAAPNRSAPGARP
jgi:hypothetical protein